MKRKSNMFVSVWVSTACGCPTHSLSLLFSPARGSKTTETLWKGSFTFGFCTAQQVVSTNKEMRGRNVCKGFYSPSSFSSRSLPFIKDHPLFSPATLSASSLHWGPMTTSFLWAFKQGSSNCFLFFWSRGTSLSFVGCPKTWLPLCKLPLY